MLTPKQIRRNEGVEQENHYKEQFAQFWLEAFSDLDIYLKKGPGRHQDSFPGIPLKEYCRGNNFPYQTIYEAVTGHQIPRDQTVLEELCNAAHMFSEEEKALALILAAQARSPKEFGHVFDPLAADYKEKAGKARKKYLAKLRREGKL